MEASVSTFDIVTTKTSTAAWHAYAMMVAATSIIVGVNWDISWHVTIGRDTFWSAPHMLMYFGGVLAGISSGWVVLRTTFRGTEEERAETVGVWGFRGPLGAWAAIWGAFAMIVSAPFDDWWHNAYGLDVEIISPPHFVLALGITAIVYASVLLLVSRQNRARDDDRRSQSFYIYVCGVMVLHIATFISEYTNPNQMHSSFFYLISCAVFPFLLAGLARASKLRWPATGIAVTYMLLDLALDYVLQLVPATPKLAPIYNRVDHLVPSGFPLLLIVPAIAIDLLSRSLAPRSGERVAAGRVRGNSRDDENDPSSALRAPSPLAEGRRISNDWLLSAAIAITFVATYVAVHWFFATFLLSSAADNFIFMGNRTWPYFARPGSWMWEFWDTDVDPLTWIRVAICVALAFAATRIALWRGNWLAKVMR